MPVSPPERLESLVEAWLAWLEHNRGATQSTLRCYELHLLRMGKWFAAPPRDPKLAAATADPLSATSADLQKYTGIYAHSLGISPRGRRPIVAAVRGFYKWAKQQRHVARNPAELLPYPAAGLRLPRSPSIAEAERLLMQPDIDTFIGLRDATMIAILIGCGLRLSGLMGLNESSVIWEADASGIERLTLRVVEKGRRERLVPAPREVAMLMRAYLGHPDLAAIDRTLANGDQVLFVTVRNRVVSIADYHGERRRIARKTIWQMIERYSRRARISEGARHPHALRHLYGTELTESDTPLLQTQALMGQEDPKNTAIYTHLAQRKLREVVDKANPLAKMRSPLLSTLRSLDRAVTGQKRVHSGPAGAHNAHSRGLREPTK